MEHKEEYIMEKKSIRMIAAMAAAAMLVPLAACGGGSAADGKTTLSFFSNNSQDKYQPIIDAFEKANPDIKIDYSTTTGSQSGYQQTLQTRISGGNLADVYIVPPEALNDLVKGNYAKDLTNESFMDKIGDSAKKAYSVDGKVYAMGVSTWTNAWVYNKDLLKKVGYDSIPATWDEFLTMCGKLKAAGITPYLEPKDGLGNAVEGWIGAESAKQGEALDARIDAGKDTFKNVYGKYYGEWDKLLKKNLMSSDVSGLSGDQVKSEFTAGRLAVYPSGPWDIDSFNETGLNYGFGPDPHAEQGRHPVRAGLHRSCLRHQQQDLRRQAQGRREVLHLPDLRRGPQALPEATGPDSVRQGLQCRGGRPLQGRLQPVHQDRQRVPELRALEQGHHRAARRDLHPAAAGRPRIHQPHAGRREPRFQVQDPFLTRLSA